jgi:hypothetical protein
VHVTNKSVSATTVIVKQVKKVQQASAYVSMVTSLKPLKLNKEKNR